MNDKTDDKKQQDNQGEGNREAARQYNEETREFAESGKVDEAAEKASEQDPGEAEAAERAGEERAKEKDPEVVRDYDKPAK